jgi:hypothetical protein
MQLSVKPASRASMFHGMNNASTRATKIRASSNVRGFRGGLVLIRGCSRLPRPIGSAVTVSPFAGGRNAESRRRARDPTRRALTRRLELSELHPGAERGALMIAAKHLFGLILVLAAPRLAAAEAGDPPLGAYNADISESSISGISSGPLWQCSSQLPGLGTIKGVGVNVGGPYYCAQATAIRARTGNIEAILTATGTCPLGPPPALKPLIKQTDEWARNRDIDDTHHIAGQKIYVFDGYNDAVVNRTVTDATHRFYFALSVRPEQRQSFLSNRDRCRPLPGNPDLRSRVLG